MSYLKEHDEHVATDLGWTAEVVYVECYLGTLMIEHCDQCPLMYVTCLHRRNEWEGPKEDQRLICQLCGVDGT
jgi:hypothetical protein